LEKAKELVKPERNTLQVSFQDVEKYNSNLAVTIVAEYYLLTMTFLNNLTLIDVFYTFSVYPFICQAVYSYVRDKADFNVEKELYISALLMSAQNTRSET
jgi:DNA replication licensing factor MCM6